MSLAWGTISVLVLLLPGFVFFATVYLPGRFSREASPLNPIGQAATAVLVSLFVHGILLLLLPKRSCSGLIGCADLGAVLALLQVTPSRPEALPDLGEQITDSLPQILAYFFTACALGGGIGWVWGWIFVRTRLRGLAQHGWVAGLAKGKQAWTFVHVVSGVSVGDFVLLYRGRLEDFGLLANGRFSYIVLTEASRSYMHFRHAPRSASVRDHELGVGGFGMDGDDRLLDSYLVIEGEDIQNAVFERYEVVLSQRGEAKLDAALERLGDVPPALAPAQVPQPRSRTLRFTLPWRPWRYVALRFGNVPGSQVKGRP
ncbi:MAG TPA: hypothetical protein VGC13_21625 [Longimicrobium sp.]|jgi:hypothetical protein|uniref:hypothetical protein n=1 Tax=Longimicrobium sp. TaxID=2029185 RepID=UPI002ED8DCB4